MVLPGKVPFQPIPGQFQGAMPGVLPRPDKMNCIIEPTEELGGIYLGNLESSSDGEFLRDSKIRAVISIVFGQEVKYPENVIPFHMLINGDDHPNFELSQEFEDTFKFIEQHRKYTSILIHCYAGVSRSATILLAYLMRKMKLGFSEALAFVRKSRPAVNPNIGFVDQLKAFEKYLAREIFSKGNKIVDKENQLQRANIQNNIHLIKHPQRKGYPLHMSQHKMF